jgi:peptide deformylase
VTPILKICQVGDPVLRGAALALSPEEVRGPEIARLIEMMRETMRDAPGVGLAAPQVGLPLALVVIEDPAELQAGLTEADREARGRRPVPFHVLANPVLQIEDATEVSFVEGCLSLRGFVATTPRALGVRVDALDHRGETVTIRARGWYARILQHEIDHLRGTLYIDRMDSRTLASVENHQRFMSR